MAYFLQQLASAAPIACLYAALAFGYALAFGLTRRADFTHGAMFAFGGQIFVLLFAWGWSALWLVLPAALALAASLTLVYAAGIGFLVARHVMRPLAWVGPNAVIVASLGLMIALMEGARIAADTKSIWIAPFLNQPLTLLADPDFPVRVTLIQALGSAFLVAAIALGMAVITWGRAGRIWRAVRDDAFAAALVGINAEKVFVVTYALAALSAALVGLVATTWYGTMDIGASLVFGLKVVFIAAIGGPASPVTAALGGAAIAFAEMLWSAYGPIAWRELFIFSAMVFILVTRVERNERLA
jgi:branched-chain amino acid transport system permease protein